MKHVVIQSISSIVLYVLIAVAIGSISSSILTSFEAIKSGIFEIEFNLLPWLIFIVFFIVWTIYSFSTRPDSRMNFWQWSIRMTEFSEDDERERVITEKATKSAYISFSISVPLLMTSFVFYPFFQQNFPTYPIYALAATLILATFVYMMTWIRVYRN